MQATIYFDGSLRHKVNYSAWVVILPSKPVMIAYDITNTKRVPDSTVAEWRAIVDALTWIKRIKTISKITIRGDNLSVIKAINSKQNLKNSKLAGYSSQCFSLLKTLEVECKAIKVERCDNLHADRLSKGEKVKFIPESEYEKIEHREYIKKIIAEHLWRINGCPQNKDEDFWYEAERLLDLSF